MADVQPFRAVRYDESAGPLDRLVAPPYDVLDAEQRAAYLARSPYNVVHLTLPDAEDAAGDTWRAWQDERALVRDERPSFWALVQDYVGPDGVARTRTGLVASLRVEPYERGVVLPHERTHRGPKEGRLRLLRATRAQLEPILLLYDGPAPVSAPDREADLAADGARLWRVDGDFGDSFADRQLLIADGHHRYETALAFHEEDGTEESAFLMVVLVSTEDPGLTIFPTHRVFDAALPDPSVGFGDPRSDVRDALSDLDELSYDTAAFVRYERRQPQLVATSDRRPDVFVVDRLGQDGISYTPDWHEAVRRVDAGDASVAYLLRPTRIEDVFAVARRGEVMPQKSTYFYPKLLSGLLFHPLG
ncbi:MAG TPA: DUF1015 domain-containing protein [Gaiellaceae bacterium]|nr:DUF1015 domain-containing protein [Gaiellaceae bacterium]